MSSCFEIGSKSKLSSRSTTGEISEEGKKATEQLKQPDGSNTSVISKGGTYPSDKLKVDLKCYKECKYRYFRFLEKIGINLKESLTKIGIKEKKLMKDAESIGPIDSE